MNEFSKYTREKNLKEIPGKEFDLAIVGGGINGAGIARDAASRGMKVILVEAESGLKKKLLL
ncbi:MAG: FAD-dependent oxidoreductase [Bdellovibrionales bacterium]